MGFTLVLPLRVAQLVLAIVVGGLSAYVFHWYDVDTLTDPPTQISFLIAVPIFSFISMLYLEITPRFLTKISHPFAHLAFEIINTLFYFSGSVALATFLSKLLFCRGKVCSAARADAVFAGLCFLLWAGTTAITCLEIFKGGVQGVKTDRKAEKAMRAERQHGAQAATVEGSGLQRPNAAFLPPIQV
jgi:hypothetical protein